MEKALLQLTGYLKGNYEPLKLRAPTELRVQGKVDTMWGSDLHDRKSINALLLTLGGCTVDWTSKKQKSVAKSSSEAEYVGVSNGGSGVKFINMLVTEVCGKVELPSILGVDNTGTMFMAKNDITGPRTKHIDIHYHFIKDMIRAGELELIYVRTDLNMADILMKNTSQETHLKHVRAIYNGVYCDKLVPTIPHNWESVKIIEGSRESGNKDSAFRIEETSGSVTEGTEGSAQTTGY